MLEPARDSFALLARQDRRGSVQRMHVAARSGDSRRRRPSGKTDIRMVRGSGEGIITRICHRHRQSLVRLLQIAEGDKYTAPCQSYRFKRFFILQFSRADRTAGVSVRTRIICILRMRVVERGDTAGQQSSARRTDIQRLSCIGKHIRRIAGSPEIRLQQHPLRG